MSRLVAVFFLLALHAGTVQAQQTYGPDDPGTQPDDDTELPLTEAQPCDEDIREDGAIVVCRELPDSERYMSPLPRPVESDRTDIPGLTDPPCWVENRTGGVCIRFGSVPEYPIMVDLTQYPEPLNAEEAAAVSRTEDGAELPRLRVGERAVIDLSED